MPQSPALAQAARAINLPHRVQVLMVAGRLEHHVFPAARFHRRQQLLRVLQRTEHRRDRARDVFAVAKHVDAMPRVIRRVGGHEYRLDPVEGQPLPTLTWDRETFAFSEAVTYFEFAVDQLVREGL